MYEGPSNYKHFMVELATRGYGVVLPELLGYGETDKPTNLEAYAFNLICKQVVGILDAEGVQKVIALGHDFGKIASFFDLAIGSVKEKVLTPFLSLAV